MTPEQFVEKWSKAELSERAASQEHFIDLCHLLGHESLDRAVLPAYQATDPKGDWSEAEVDQKVLANLLRLNHARAKGEIIEPIEAPTSAAKSPSAKARGGRNSRKDKAR